MDWVSARESSEDSYGHIVMAYIVMAYTVMACMVSALADWVSARKNL